MGPGPGGHLESLSHLVSHDQGFIFPSKCRRKQGFYFLFTKRRVPCSPVAFWSLLVGPPSAHGIWSTHDAQSRAAGRWDLSPPWSHSGLSLLGLLVTGSQPQSECGLGRTQWSRRPTSRCVLCSVAGSVGDSHPPPPALWSSLDMSGGVPSGASLNSPPAFWKARVSPRPPAQLPPLSGPISRVSSECGWRGSLPRGTSGVPADPRQSQAT